MGKYSNWLEVLKKNSEIEDLIDWEVFKETNNRAYLKRMAIDKCINFIARTMSLTEFRVKKNGERVKDIWWYKLNVRPNSDNSAADFWQKFIYKLIYNNEVLVVINDSDDLLIADSYSRIEYANYEDKFQNVTIKDYTFQRSFNMNEVIFIEYNNERLEDYIAALFSDYGELFGRMFETKMREGQIRGGVEVDATRGVNDKSAEKLQKFINKLFNSFKNNSIAIVPKTKGLAYEEYSDGASKGSSNSDEMNRLINQYVNDVAEIVGIPPSLIHGDVVNLESNKEAYIEFCAKPLIKKISDELTAKIFEVSDILNDSKIEASGIDKPDIFKLAANIDKLISSRVLNPNEVRERFDYCRVDGLDEFVLTKNYERTEHLKGGENDDSED